MSHSQSQKKQSSNSRSSSVNIGAAAASKPVAAVEQESSTTEEFYDDYRSLLLNYDPAKNKTSPDMTKYEKALIIGKRATQIASGAIPLIDVPARMTNAIDIAEEELRQKKTPIIIRRDLGNNKYEFWRIRDMNVL